MLNVSMLNVSMLNVSYVAYYVRNLTQVKRLHSIGDGMLHVKPVAEIEYLLLWLFLVFVG